MAIEYKKLKEILQKAFPGDEVLLVDTAGDNNHYEVTIISAAFEGLSLVMQHKMVHEAIGPMMGRDLHALTINTKTETE